MINILDLATVQHAVVADYLNLIFAIGAWMEPISILLRPLFFLLDSFIYLLIPIVYSFAIALIDLPIALDKQAEIILHVSRNIYGLLAIVMLFRVAFSLLTMLADPDKIQDKERGAAKIFTNIIITIILIAAVPFIFDQAMKLQKEVIDQGLLEKIVRPNYSGPSLFNNLGSYVSGGVFSVFFMPTPANLNQGRHVENYQNAIDQQQGPNILKLLALAPDLLMPMDRTTSFFFINLNIPIPLPIFGYTYLFGLSTIAGLYTLWLFISLAIDIAYRSIKLFVLQVISPIAIVSYIDPNSGKSGIFKKWTQEVLKTYFSLFARLVSLSFVALLLYSVEFSYITAQDFAEGSVSIFGSWNPFVRLFYMLALLTFIKTAPKMFENIFGYKGKSKDEKFGSSLLRGLMGGALSATVGAATGGYSAKKHGFNPLHGAVRGGWSGFNKGGNAAYGGKTMDYLKTMGSGNEAAQKYFGYKSEAERKKDTVKFDAGAKAADKNFDKFNESAINNNGQNKKNVNDILQDLSNDGVNVIEDADAKMLSKAYAKVEGYNGILDKDTSNLVSKVTVEGTRNKILQRKVRDANRKVALATTVEEKITAEKHAKVLEDKLDLSSKDLKDLEKSLKYHFEDPRNDRQKEIYKSIDRAEDKGRKLDVNATITADEVSILVEKHNKGTQTTTKTTVEKPIEKNIEYDVFDDDMIDLSTLRRTNKNKNEDIDENKE